MGEEGERENMGLLIRFKRCFFRAVEIGSLVVISIGLIVPAGGCATVQEKKIKDSISQISFSHDGKKVLFDRCRGGECQIQVYDLETGELSAYQSPPNERWTIQVMRGTETVPKSYFFGDIVNPSDPLLSKDGTRLFFRERGGKYFLYSPDGNHRLAGGGGSVNSAAISPNGELLGVIAAHICFEIYKVLDGSKVEDVCVPRVRSNPSFEKFLPKIKMLPELPSHIINR